VDDAVEDSIGVGRLADHLVPRLHGKLARDQRRAAAVALLDDLHQIAPLAGGEPLRPPIVQDQEIDFRKSPEQPGEAAIAVLQLELREETRRARVEGGVAVATGFMRKGARQP